MQFVKIDISSRKFTGNYQRDPAINIMTVDKHIIIYQLAVSEDDISMSYINISMFTQHVSCSLFEEGLY